MGLGLELRLGLGLELLARLAPAALRGGRRYRGDAGEIQGRYRGDIGEI